jgi:hypothetical protein
LARLNFRLNCTPSKPEQQVELDLKNHRPMAGETRHFSTGEALFFSPVPVPTGQTPMDFGGSFIEVNDTYLDLGSSNLTKSFQARLAVSLPTVVVIVCLFVLPTLMGFAAFINPFDRSFWFYFNNFFESGLSLALWCGGGAALIGLYAIISTTRSVISSYTFGMAIDNPNADTVHFLVQEVMTPIHGLGKWEAIRAYMEKGPEFCPGKAPYEGRHTFDKERQDMKEEYQHNERSALSAWRWLVVPVPCHHWVAFPLLGCRVGPWLQYESAARLDCRLVETTAAGAMGNTKCRVGCTERQD